MTKTIQIVKQKNKEEIIRKQETTKILCLDNPADDDLHKIYFIGSEDEKEKYFKVIGTAFGAASCSCIEQTKNPYSGCKHMKILDEILEQSSDKIKKVKTTPIN